MKNSPLRKYRLLALDVDGTLLDDEKRIPDANRRALHRLVGAGGLFAIASGRMPTSIAPIAERLGLDPIIVSYNGGKILGPAADGRPVISHDPLPSDVAAEFIHFAEANDYLLNVYHEDRLYTEASASRGALMDLYTRRTGAGYEVAPLRSFIGTAPTKLILLAPPDEIDRLLPRFRETYAGRAFLTKSEPEYLEIMAPGVDKGRGLERMAAHYGLELSEIVAAGDALNDVDLLRQAGLGVAVANASDELKSVADVVTERDNNAGAVAEIIERWF